MIFTISNLSGYFDGYRFHKGPFTFVIENGSIAQILSKSSKGDIDGSGKFLSVPFCDGHTHLIFEGDRSFELPLKIAGSSYADILEKGGGILNTVKATRNASDEELLQSVLRRLDIMMSSGTLTVEAKSGYGLKNEEELRQLRILNKANEMHPVEVVPTYCGAHAIPFDKDRDEYIEDIIQLIPEIVRDNLAKSIDVFCDRGAYTVSETLRIFDAASANNLPIRVHADELEYTGIAKIAATKYNLRSADHLLMAKEDDFQVLEKRNTTAMFMPAATIGLFSKNYPQGWKSTHVRIGLGSDFNPNNVVTSMQTALRLAVFLYRMLPEHAMKAATSGSFRGIYGYDLPALKESSAATFILFNSPNIANLVTQFDRNLVTHVFKDGELLVENKNVKRI